MSVLLSMVGIAWPPPELPEPPPSPYGLCLESPLDIFIAVLGPPLCHQSEAKAPLGTPMLGPSPWHRSEVKAPLGILHVITHVNN